jgi:hypothetical protein
MVDATLTHLLVLSGSAISATIEDSKIASR